mgnify:CR=1 FL=1
MEHHPEAIQAAIPAEVPQAATDHQDRIGHLQAATTLPALPQGVLAVTRQAEVHRSLPEVQAVATLVEALPEVQEDLTVEADLEAAEEEGKFH